MLFNEEYKKLMSILTERCIPPVDVLSKYKDDDNAFLSFTSYVHPRTSRESDVNKKGTKIGINPMSDYDTPIGVYFYPIKAYWNNLERKDIPFAGNNPHLYIVKAKNYDRLLIGSRYTNEDLERDYNELQEIFPQIDFDNLLGSIDSEYRTHPAQTFWSITRLLSIVFAKKVESKQPVIWTQILRRFYDGVVDDEGKGFIHKNEPTQAVLWTKAQFDVVDYLDRTCGGQHSKYYQSNWEDNKRSLQKLLKYYFVKEDLPQGVDPNINFFDKFQKFLQNISMFYSFIENNAEYFRNNIKDKTNNLLLRTVISRKDTDIAYIYANKIMNFENLPEKLVDIITSDYQNTKDLISKTGFKYINETILKVIYNEPSLSYEYFAFLLDSGKLIPDEALENISNDALNSIMSVFVRKGREIPDILLQRFIKQKFINLGSSTRWIKSIIMGQEDYRNYLRLAKYIYKTPEVIPDEDIEFIAQSPYKFDFIETILVPMGVDVQDLFEKNPKNNYYSQFYPLSMAILGQKASGTQVNENVFDYLYDKVLQESFQSQDIDMDRAYEIFNQEYLQSTGKSWSKDKFLQRARNWEFWGDQNGFVTTRSQNSGFVKLVGAAGSDKSKYKGFKELSQNNLPVWGMVDGKIRELLKKMGYRGPNMVERLAFQTLLKSGKMDAVLGGAKLESIKGDEITLTYPDIGTVTKYFMGSPEYWKMMHRSFLPK